MMNSKMNPVRIVATADEPYAFSCFDRYPLSCKFPGYEIEYIYTIIHLLMGLPVVLLKVDSFEDIEKSLDSGTADIAGTSMMLDLSYLDRWSFTPIYLWDGVAFISKENIETHYQNFELFDAFSIYLWALILITTLTVVAIRRASEMIYRNQKITCINYVTRKFRSHCFYAFWFIVLSVLLNFYSNLMVVQLMTPSQFSTTPFDSIPELGKKLLRSECRLAILEKYQDDVEFHKTLINPDADNKNYWANDYREAFKINPPHYTASRKETVELILNNSCVIGVDFATMETYYYSRFCNIKFVSFPTELSLFGYVYYFTNIETASNISAVMSSSSVSAYPAYLANKYYFNHNPPHCDSLLKNIRITDPLPLAKFHGLFILYFASIVTIGFFTFGQYLIEKILKTTIYSRKWKRK